MATPKKVPAHKQVNSKEDLINLKANRDKLRRYDAMLKRLDADYDPEQPEHLVDED